MHGLEKQRVQLWAGIDPWRSRGAKTQAQMELCIYGTGRGLKSYQAGLWLQVASRKKWSVGTETIKIAFPKVFLKDELQCSSLLTFKKITILPLAFSVILVISDSFA